MHKYVSKMCQRGASGLQRNLQTSKEQMFQSFGGDATIKAATVDLSVSSERIQAAGGGTLKNICSMTDE